MAINDETIKLILDVSGDQAVKQLTTDIVALEAELKNLVTAWNQGSVSSGDFFKQSGKLSSQIGEAKDELTWVMTRTTATE